MTLSFVVAAIGCLFAGLCYAEFAAMIPIAGSAYTYAYATMGELVAWTIGLGAGFGVCAGGGDRHAIAWSEYLNNLLGGDTVCVLPLAAGGLSAAGCRLFNAPALLILFLLTALLIKGERRSRRP